MTWLNVFSKQPWIRGLENTIYATTKNKSFRAKIQHLTPACILSLLRNKFHFSNIHRSMNAMDRVQSKSTSAYVMQPNPGLLRLEATTHVACHYDHRWEDDFLHFQTWPFDFLSCVCMGLGGGGGGGVAGVFLEEKILALNMQEKMNNCVKRGIKQLILPKKKKKKIIIIIWLCLYL